MNACHDCEATIESGEICTQCRMWHCEGCLLERNGLPVCDTCNRNPNHVTPSWVYQQQVCTELRSRGYRITGEWFDRQRIPSGKLRTDMHRDMGLTVIQSADELEPFAKAQLTGKRYKPEHWRDGCLEFTKDRCQEK